MKFISDYKYTAKTENWEVIGKKNDYIPSLKNHGSFDTKSSLNGIDKIQLIEIPRKKYILAFINIFEKIN